jgi:hypothetical protein
VGRIGAAAQILPTRGSDAELHELVLSISLFDEDVAALDRYVLAAGVPSRSAAIQRGRSGC